MRAAERELVDILREAKTLLSLPGNEFVYSSWISFEEAVAELDGLIASLESGQLPERSRLTTLFAPTGAIQEVSVSSGWGDVFLDFAQRFDAAESRVYESPPVARWKS